MYVLESRYLDGMNRPYWQHLRSLMLVIAPHCPDNIGCSVNLFWKQRFYFDFFSSVSKDRDKVGNVSFQCYSFLSDYTWLHLAVVI